jgi:hypothetical protein
MSTRNFDSSILTKRKRDKALGAYANAVNAAINNNNGVQTVRTTQPTYQSGEVVTQQNLGKCACVTDALANPYPFNPSGGGCGCGIGP